MPRANREGKVWTREELILAIGLYFVMPWGRIHSHAKEIKALSRLMRRSPGALAMKMGNIGRLDQRLAKRGVGGLSHGGKTEALVWNEFEKRREDLIAEYNRIRMGLGGRSLPLEDDDVIKAPPGLDGVRLAHYRINQSYFRRSVLAAYGGACCITGLNDPRLLVASHIKPWSKCASGQDRTVTENGLCLSALYDRAFDKGLFTVDVQYKIALSPSLKDYLTTETYNQHFALLDNRQIELPTRGRPAVEFLEYHNNYVFVSRT